MTIEEACKNFVPKDTNIPESDIVLIDAANTLMLRIREYKLNNPDFKDLGVENSFINFFGTDLSLSCTILEVSDIRDNKIEYIAEESWNYGGYEKGYILIPMEYFNMSDEELDKKCKEYAKKHYKEEIDRAKKQIDWWQKDLAENEKMYNKYNI